MSWGGRSVASSGYCSQDESDVELEHFFSAHISFQCKAAILQWDAFSLPELSNFLRILQREEEEHMRLIAQRYSVARDKLQEALRSYGTPGWQGV
ncbi:Ras association domain-containing protein 1 [Bagarius yarrelli]|uniref:Ras association domain-containing protein 1 n=1 Tax=Bagarius yarrelli TaxID=175774 RepID=A0A556VTV4_BAGYA|nr:Ras association domain-containing protein 1 [Bagarius yarrelli]